MVSGSTFDLGSTNVALALDCPFPSNVNAGPGVGLVKSGSVWDLSLNYPPLTEEVVPVPGNLYGAFYDTALAQYTKVRMDNFIATATGLDTRQPIVDAPYNVTVHDRYVALTMALTAPRIVTLPPANSVPGGREVMLEDEVGGLSSVNYFNVQPTGADTIDGRGNYILATPYGGARFRSDGTSRWSIANTSNFYLVPAAATTYTASPDDNVIAWPAFTAPVVTTLPAAAAYQKGRRITIADRNGSCTTTNTMKVVPAGSDTINGSASPAIATMNAAYSAITLFSDGISAWTVVGGGNISAAITFTSAQISDASALGRQLITNATAALDRTALGSGAVGDAVFTSATQGAAQSAMGLGTMSTQAANGVSITGGSISGVAISGGTDVNTTITTPTISGGTANNMVIGGTTPAAASFTSLNGGQLAGSRNMIINGIGRIDQRNSNNAVTPTGAIYFGDRWAFTSTQASKLNVGSGISIGGAISGGATQALYASVASPYTPAASDLFLIYQFIEGRNIARLGWGSANAIPATLSFWAYAQVGGTYCASITNGASTRCYLATFTLPASVWTYVTITVPGDTTGTWPTDNTAGASVRFNLGAGSTYIGTAGAWSAANVIATAGSVQLVANAVNTLLYVTEVQLEPGPVATPFEWHLIGTEMANCQRYYQRYTSAGASIRFTGYHVAGYVPFQTISFPTMRAAATASIIGTWYSGNCSAPNIASVGNNSLALGTTVTATGGFDMYNQANGGFDLSAEL